MRVRRLGGLALGLLVACGSSDSGDSGSSGGATGGSSQGGAGQGGSAQGGSGASASGGSTSTGGAGGSTSTGGAGGSTSTGGAGGSTSTGGAGGSTSTGGAGGSASTGGSGGALDTCESALNVTLQALNPQVELASFDYYPGSGRCELTPGITGNGPFSVTRAISTAGTSLYAANVFGGWQWVSFSAGALVAPDNEELRPLPENTDVTVVVRDLTGAIELTVVFRVSGDQLDVSDVSFGS